ncbi:hypothetical protein EZH22_23155 [Xanthobacter dioxanivorans]|uniref:Uncharacterized protein n=1 Tax=Xanthobacter dioxanivorans TaxID=2528964 RepID=A0A974PLN7_9HYPH|nr:hypothetical protein [Xanthobacter dioxanivorans]QRG05893.1 hypothetical protein EZH22_23155 [Xanthobacter dioxanivorans]
MFGDAERGIDNYFDEYFFKSQNNSSRLVVLNDLGSSIARALPDRSPATHFSYKGICGRSVYIMARHGRPSNANYFRMITHAFAPRAAVWIDHAVACSGEIVYLEGCGYKDNVKRKGPIGVEVTDPYLGDGVRVPAFVRGYTCMLDAQFVFGQRLVTRNELPDRFAFWCDLIDRQDARVFRDKVNVDALTVRGEARSGAATGGVTVISRSLDPTWRKVHVKVPGGDGGASRTALVIVNSEFSQDDAKSTVYILTVHGKNISSGRLYGEDVLTFSQELDDMVSISSLRPAKHSVAVIMTGSEDQ